VIEQTRGVWIAEFAELSGIQKRDINHVKNFLSKQEDRARPAYGRRSERVPRQFITAGTTNDQEYLLDTENRRFWPVAITRFNVDALAKIADQLWAEAAYWEAKDESIVLRQDLWQAAADEQSEREIENPFQRIFAERFAHKERVTSQAVWEAAGIPLERQPQASRTVGQAMKKLGFIRRQIRAINDSRGPRGSYFYERE
jgi:predicted P-loop ATPase